MLTSKWINWTRATKVQNICSASHSLGSRCNELNIQMIDNNLQRNLFNNNSQRHKADVNEVKSQLSKFNIDCNKTQLNPSVMLQLPPMQGSNIEEHFLNAANDYLNPYLSLLEEFQTCDIPPQPSKWSCSAGWTKYDHINNSWRAVDVPDDDLLFFDIEIIVPESAGPTAAVALGRSHWFSWTSEYLASGRRCPVNKVLHKEDLIPLHLDGLSDRQKCVIGHFVSFDRARIRDEYDIHGTGTRFLDTMAMHIAICGMTTLQKSLKQSFDKENFNNKVWKKYFSHKRFQQTTTDLSYESVSESEKWINDATFNSLEEVFSHYYPASKTKKDREALNLLMKGSTQIVIDNFQKIMNYCSNDVLMTAMIFKKQWPEYRHRCPHPASLMGGLEMGSPYLPLQEPDWDRYKVQSSAAFDRVMLSEQSLLQKLARAALSFQKDNRFSEDPWLWDLDWSHTRTSSLPRWFRDLIPRTSDDNNPSLISSNMRAAVKLLRLQWDGLPLHYDRRYKWGVLLPGRLCASTHRDPRLLDPETDQVRPVVPVERVSPRHVELLSFPMGRYLTYWAPVMLSRVRQFSEFVSTRQLRSGQYLVMLERIVHFISMLPLPSDIRLEMDAALNTARQALVAKTRFSNAKPISDNIVYYFQVNELADMFKEAPTYGSLNPDISFCWFHPLPHENGQGNFVGSPLSKSFLGHIQSGRLTSDGFNHLLEEMIDGKKSCVYWRNYQDRIESQLVVRVPDQGHAAILPQLVTSGTVTRRAVERTWLTAMNASCDKIGSELKAMVRPPRDSDWVIVGADVDSQEQWIAALLGDSVTGMHGGTPLGWLLLQGNRADGTDLHSQTSRLIGVSRDAAKVLNYSRMYGAGLLKSRDTLLKFNSSISSKEALDKIRRLMAETKGVRDDKGIWRGGIESNVFSKLEEVARRDIPETPVLGARISKSLEKKMVNDSFMTSRCNWVVQSSGVDYLHCLVTITRILIQQHAIAARLCVCIHDEVRYLCAGNDRYRLALALQIANLYTRALFASRLGFDDLPQCVAFFSEVDIDYCLRKNSQDDCVTPSNADGLLKNYSIQKGESLTIHDILEKTGGQL